MTALLDEKQAAARLRVTTKALQGWRYRMEDLQCFVQAAFRTSTSDPGPTAHPSPVHFRKC